jgi:hypothetical protein
MSEHDYRDCAGAVRVTVASLEASGVPPFVIASTLLAAAVESYKNCFPDQSLTSDDVRELIERTAL